MSNGAVGITWDPARVKEMDDAIKDTIAYGKSYPADVVDRATVKFAVSARAHMKPGRKNRKVKRDNFGRDYIDVMQQGKPAIRRYLPRHDRKDAKSNVRRAMLINRYKGIKTRGAGRRSWFKAFRDLGKLSGKSPSFGLARASGVKKDRKRATNTITSRLKYLQKVWPNVASAAMASAARQMQADLSKKVTREYERIWQ